VSAEVGHLQHGDRLEGVADEEYGEGLLGDEHPHHAVVFAVGLGRRDGVVAGVGECERKSFTNGWRHRFVDGFDAGVVLQAVQTFSFTAMRAGATAHVCALKGGLSFARQAA
jgi:hypothetical protein